MDTERLHYLITQLSGFRRLRDLRRSAFYAQCRGEIDSLLDEPRVVSSSRSAPASANHLRVAQWNIEKGRQLDRVINVLRSDPVLSASDILLINEVDHGMNRTGNLDVAGVIGEALGMNVVFGAAHIELTKGTGEELSLSGENRESRQGNAVLSRYPVMDANLVRLPTCFEPFEFHEKRYGTRNCVWAKLKIGDRALWAGCTHLEVRNTPACRARQMVHLLEKRPGEPSEPSVIGGDLNCNGFSRGTFLRTLRSTARVVARPPEVLRRELRHPEQTREPLFGAMRAAGFFWEGLNTDEATAAAPIGSLEDAAFLPSFVAECVRRRLEPHRGHLWFKLDWLFGRNVRSAHGCELTVGEKVPLPSCGVRAMELTGRERISDHAPIWADIRLEAP
jgi:endonuclease/exonuclease/phosphatase family metal-dependent hydrolase